MVNKLRSLLESLGKYGFADLLSSLLLLPIIFM